MSKADFNSFRFDGLNPKKKSNKYLTMDRVSADGSKCIVKVADEHLLRTKYGYALILDESHVLFLKSWQVSENWFGNEVLVEREYFNVKEWGNFPDFEDNSGNLAYETWIETAKEQEEHGNLVSWEL